MAHEAFFEQMLRDDKQNNPLDASQSFCPHAAEGDRRSSEGRVDLGVITNDDKENDDEEDDDKEDEDVHQLIAKQRRRM